LNDDIQTQTVSQRQKHEVNSELYRVRPESPWPFFCKKSLKLIKIWRSYRLHENNFVSLYS